MVVYRVPTQGRVIQTLVGTTEWCPTQLRNICAVYSKSARMDSHFKLKDAWQAPTYRQSEIVTVRELVVTNSLEVDCLQIEHELHCH